MYRYVELKQILNHRFRSSNQCCQIVSIGFPLFLMVAQVSQIAQLLNLAPHGNINDIGTFQSIIQVANMRCLFLDLDLMVCTNFGKVLLQNNPTYGTSSAIKTFGGKLLCGINLRIEKIGLEQLTDLIERGVKTLF